MQDELEMMKFVSLIQQEHYENFDQKVKQHEHYQNSAKKDQQ